MPFPTHVNRFQPFGMQGDAGSTNTHNSQVAYQGSLIADKDGLIVGRFAWVVNGAASNKTAGTLAPNGFVRNEGIAQIDTIFQESTLHIPAGYAVTIYTQGDFWAQIGAAGSNGDKIFAKTADGTLLTGKAGTDVTGAVETDFYLMGDAASGDTVIISTWSKRA